MDHRYYSETKLTIIDPEDGISRQERKDLGVLGRTPPQSHMAWKILLAIIMIGLVTFFTYWFSRHQ